MKNIIIYLTIQIFIFCNINMEYGFALAPVNQIKQVFSVGSNLKILPEKALKQKTDFKKLNKNHVVSKKNDNDFSVFIQLLKGCLIFTAVISLLIGFAGFITGLLIASHVFTFTYAWICWLVCGIGFLFSFLSVIGILWSEFQDVQKAPSKNNSANKKGLKPTIPNKIVTKTTSSEGAEFFSLGQRPRGNLTKKNNTTKQITSNGNLAKENNKTKQITSDRNLAKKKDITKQIEDDEKSLTGKENNEEKIIEISDNPAQNEQDMEEDIIEEVLNVVENAHARFTKKQNNSKVSVNKSYENSLKKENTDKNEVRKIEKSDKSLEKVKAVNVRKDNIKTSKIKKLKNVIEILTSKVKEKIQKTRSEYNKKIEKEIEKNIVQAQIDYINSIQKLHINNDNKNNIYYKELQKIIYRKQVNFELLLTAILKSSIIFKNDWHEKIQDDDFFIRLKNVCHVLRVHESVSIKDKNTIALIEYLSCLKLKKTNDIEKLSKQYPIVEQFRNIYELKQKFNEIKKTFQGVKLNNKSNKCNEIYDEFKEIYIWPKEKSFFKSLFFNKNSKDKEIKNNILECNDYIKKYEKYSKVFPEIEKKYSCFYNELSNILGSDILKNKIDWQTKELEEYLSIFGFKLKDIFKQNIVDNNSGKYFENYFNQLLNEKPILIKDIFEKKIKNGEEHWDSLVNNGYIDKAGKILNKFTKVKSIEKFELKIDNKNEKIKIYNCLKEELDISSKFEKDKTVDYPWFKFSDEQKKEKDLFCQFLKIKFMVDNDDFGIISCPRFIDKYINPYFEKEMYRIYKKDKSGESNVWYIFMKKILNNLDKGYQYYYKNKNNFGGSIHYTHNSTRITKHVNNPEQGKFVIKTFGDGFRKEIFLSNFFSHPNIVSALDFIKQNRKKGNTVWYMVMEKYKDVLANRMNKINNDEDIYKLMEDIALGLKYLHEEFGLIHCDLKIDNIFFNTKVGNNVIGDFGAPVIKGQEIACTTPNLYPPEILGNSVNIKTKADESWDVFSLGCILFGCLFRDSEWGAVNIIADLKKEQIKNMMPDKKLALMSSNDYENYFKRNIIRAYLGRKIIANKSLNISEGLFNFMIRFLAPDPEDRPKIDEILKRCKERKLYTKLCDNYKGRLYSIEYSDHGSLISDNYKKNNIKDTITTKIILNKNVKKYFTNDVIEKIIVRKQIAKIKAQKENSEFVNIDVSAIKDLNRDFENFNKEILKNDQFLRLQQKAIENFLLDIVPNFYIRGYKDQFENYYEQLEEYIKNNLNKNEKFKNNLILLAKEEKKLFIKCIEQIVSNYSHKKPALEGISVKKCEKLGLISACLSAV